MQRIRTRSPLRAAAVLTAGAVALSLGAPALAAPAQEPVEPAEQVVAPVPQIEWGECGEGLEAFECASVEVPTDYDQPEGATTSIGLTRLPATDPDARIGTLFTNPGGPGGSGVDFVQQVGQVAYTDDVRARFDILGFDPRSVMRSDPATCFRTEAEELAALADQVAFPVTAAEENAFMQENNRMSASCRITSRDRFEHASTANVARDMDLLRQAVGDEELTYIGYSYGTFLGATYAKLFPDRVRALALDGTVVPEDFVGEVEGADTSLGDRMRQGPGADETFGEFLRHCAEAGEQRCSLAGLGDPEEVVEDLFERLKTDPYEVELPDGTTMEITYAIAVASTFSSLYSSAEWPLLADLLTELAVGEPALTPAAAKVAERAVDNPDAPRRRGEDYNSVGGAMATMCADSGTTGAPAAYPDIVDEVDAEAPHFGRFRAWVGIQCEYLRLTDDDAYLGPWDQEVESPVLVIGTRFDPATPYSGTQPYADHFPDARVLTLEGWGHTALGVSACTDEAITDYLVGLDAPADGTSCQPDVQPFEPIPQAQSEARTQTVPDGPRSPLLMPLLTALPTTG